jgi:hypothetical protein
MVKMLTKMGFTTTENTVDDLKRLWTRGSASVPRQALALAKALLKRGFNSNAIRARIFLECVEFLSFFFFETKKLIQT